MTWRASLTTHRFIPIQTGIIMATASLQLNNFRTVFDDNFTKDTGLDHSLWTDSWGNANQFTVSSGGLTLSGYEKPYWNPVAIMQHTLGNSAGEGYGLYQFSGYGNAGQGIGINFIMWRADNKYLDASTPGKATEIDILESWDKTHTGQSTIHYYNSSVPNDNGQEFHQINISPATLHTYAMDWERGSLTFYVDGQEIYQDTTHAPLDAADGGSNEVMGAQVINESSLVTAATVQLHITDMSYSAPIQTLPAGSIYLGVPGTVQEASPGAGVTVSELISAPTLTGSVYAEVLTSTGAVESGYQAETLGLHHSVTVKINLLKSGDVIRVVSSTTGPSATATSSAITITDPAQPTLAVSAPGSVQEASVGAGVTVTETITATHLTGTVYEEVLTASGTVETAYTAVALSAGGTASLAVHLDTNGDVIKVANGTTGPTVTATSNPVIITDAVLTGALPQPLYTGTETVTGTGGIAGLQLERITQGSYNTPGSTGWVKATVASSGQWSASITFTKPGMLAHIYAENGGSSKVIDLVNGTPSAPPASVARIKDIATSIQPSILKEMSAWTMSKPNAASAMVLRPETTGGGALLSVTGVSTDHPATVSDHLRVLHV